MNLIRYVLHKLRLAEAVWLVDFDGATNLRLVHRKPYRMRGQRYAIRFGLGVKDVVLLPDGRVGGCSYVDRWEPIS